MTPMTMTTAAFTATDIELKAPTRGGGIPAVGWERIAVVIQARAGSTGYLTIEIAGQHPLVVDLAARTFSWNAALDRMPATVQVQRVRLSEQQPAVSVGWADLEPLLWMIGLHGIPSTPAWWLNDGERYELVRWPNFTALTYSPDHVRLTAVLGTAPMSAAELARAAGVELAAAQSIVNAFGLMGLLRALPGAAASAPVGYATQPAVDRGGLFQRLRARLGR